MGFGRIDDREVLELIGSPGLCVVLAPSSYGFFFFFFAKTHNF